MGANVWAKSPAPQGQTLGKTTEREYDDKGRLLKDKIVNHGGAYTRYEYPNNGIQSKVFSTIIDTNSNNTGDSADEVLSESWTDGAGRVRRSRTEHPGSIGGWSASVVEYDKLGRATKQSVPTEVSVPDPNNPDTWTPAGDDNRGPGVWLWTHQKYDWKNRVIRKINTDGIDQIPYNDSDVLISYEGCGCAGGQVTTIQSENVPRDDQPTTNARRTQKVYEDILGRSWKTVVMKWDGTTAYTTTEQKFNGRDQVLKTIQTDNVSTPIKTQEVTMTYDGHGRMKTRHYPIEDSLAYTDWTYNADDSIQQIIDPRLAITTFTYGDPRGLTTQVSYSVPNGSTIPVTPTTTFAYDNLGNRTSMTTAGVNTTTYTYDQLSRMTSETVDFDALANNLTIGYTYSLGGGLKSITDPFSSTVNYTNDRGGRLTAVTGTAYAQNTTGDYASNIKYRAFGQVKQMDYDLPNGDSQIKLEYDSRLRVNHSEATQAGSSSSFLMKADFSYLADSRMQAKNDLLADAWDRTNKYDFAGRLAFNQFGMGTATGGQGTKLVYEQTIQYDAFSQMTSRVGVHWDNYIGFTATYTNGRKNALSGESITFDASGNIVHSQPDVNNPHDLQDTTFEASGRQTIFVGKTKGRQGGWLNYVSEDKNEQIYDGEGRAVIEKMGHRNYHINNVPTTTLTTVVTGYQVWSSVLGASLTTITPQGNKLETSVYAGGAVIAKQKRFVDNTNYDSIDWTTADPVAGTVAKFSYSAEGSGTGLENTEPLGQKIHPQDPEDYNPPGNQSIFGFADDPEWQCEAGVLFWGGEKGGFTDLPFHCQKRMLMDLSYDLADLYGFTRKEKESPIALLDSPIPSIESFDSPSENVLVYARTSSAKQQEKPKKKKRNSQPKTIKKQRPLAVVQSLPATNDPISAISSALSLYDSIVNSETYREGTINAVIYNSGQGHYIETAEGRSKMKDYVRRLITPECGKAFKDAGLEKPFDVLRDGDVIFAARELLQNSENNEALQITEEARAFKNQSSAPETTMQPSETINGRGIIFVRKDAFTTMSNWIFTDFAAHGFIHAQGIGKRESWYQFKIPVLGWNTYGHDLSAFPGYEEIVQACGMRKK